MRVLVTGATGFVGRAVMARIGQMSGIEPVAGSRRAQDTTFGSAETVINPELGPGADWSSPLVGVDSIIHCAGRAHHISSDAGLAFTELLRCNTEGTLVLAEQAAACGVKRFIFVSSSAVNGDATLAQPFTEEDVPAPASPSAIAKFRAEQGLHELAHRTGMAVTVVRPALVYGRGAPGNLARLRALVSRGVPLPFGLARNIRTLVAVESLADLLAICLVHPDAPGQCFLAADATSVSTADIVRHIARSLECGANLIPVPPILVSGALGLIGRRSMAQQLLGSLQIDSSKARNVLGWRPGSPETAQWA